MYVYSKCVFYISVYTAQLCGVNFTLTYWRVCNFLYTTLHYTCNSCPYTTVRRGLHLSVYYRLVFRHVLQLHILHRVRYGPSDGSRSLASDDDHRPQRRRRKRHRRSSQKSNTTTSESTTTTNVTNISSQPIIQDNK